MLPDIIKTKTGRWGRAPKRLLCGKECEHEARLAGGSTWMKWRYPELLHLFD